MRMAMWAGLMVIGGVSTASAQMPIGIRLQEAAVKPAPEVPSATRLPDSTIVIKSSAKCRQGTSTTGQLCAKGWDLAAVRLVTLHDSIGPGDSLRVAVVAVNRGATAAPSAPLSVALESGGGSGSAVDAVIPELGPLDSAVVPVVLVVPTNPGWRSTLTATIDPRIYSGTVASKNNVVTKKLEGVLVSESEVLMGAEPPASIERGRPFTVTFVIRNRNSIATLRSTMLQKASTRWNACTSEERLAVPPVPPGGEVRLTVAFELDRNCPTKGESGVLLFSRLEFASGRAQKFIGYDGTNKGKSGKDDYAPVYMLSQ